LIAGGLREVRRLPLAQARAFSHVREHDFSGVYVADLASVVDFDVIRSAGLRLGVDPLGGAGVHYWSRIAIATAST
jgi:phosphoglucomutase